MGRGPTGSKGEVGRAGVQWALWGAVHRAESVGFSQSKGISTPCSQGQHVGIPAGHGPQDSASVPLCLGFPPNRCLSASWTEALSLLCELPNPTRAHPGSVSRRMPV